MRTNNLKSKNTIISVYFILIVLAIVMATIFSAFTDLTSSPALTFAIIIIVFAVIFFITHAISKFFEYDSDGIKVVLINRGLILSSEKNNYREKQAEFYKEDLIAFKFNNYFFFKSLSVTYKSERGHKHTDTFNVTLLSRKKRRYIKQSLSKMIKYNRKAKQNS